MFKNHYPCIFCFLIILLVSGCTYVETVRDKQSGATVYVVRDSLGNPLSVAAVPTPTQKEDITMLRLDGVIYNENPTQRVAMIGEKQYREGDIGIFQDTTGRKGTFKIAEILPATVKLTNITSGQPSITIELKVNQSK